jgi:hypothetical protein
MYNMEVKAPAEGPQLLLQTQQQSQQMSYFVKPDMGKAEGQESNINGQISSNLKQSVDASRRRYASGQTEGFASPAPATGGQAQPSTATVESQLQRLIGLVQARQ